MKTIKTILIVMMITLLAGCTNSSVPETITFDRMEFTYQGTTNDDYFLYESGNFRLELQQKDDGSAVISYEKFQDIYLIEGTKDDYQIRKNGILVQICSGEEIACTGFEVVEFSKDATTLFAVFEANTLSISTIIFGVFVIVGVGSLFLIPKKYFKVIKLKSFKISQVLLIRTVIILLILIGLVIVILSF